MYDLIIVGGGMSGISVAHAFRDQQVLILEKHRLLAGATGHNAGFMVRGFGEHFNRTAARWGVDRALEISEIHRRSHEQIYYLADELRCSYQRRGSLSVPLSDQELSDLQESFELMQQVGLPVQWISRANTGLVTARDALLHESDGWLDSQSFWRRLAEGIPAVTECDIHGISDIDDGVAVETSQGIFKGSKIVFCLNAFAADLLSELQGRYIPIRGQMLVLSLRRQELCQQIILGFYGDVYWRFSDRHFIFGGLEFLEPQTEVGVATQLSAALQEKQLAWISTHFQGDLFTELTPVESWFSTMAFTVDGFPFVGKLAKDHHYVLSGLCGLGHSYAMEAARWLRELIRNDRDIIPQYCRSDRIDRLPVYTGGNWRILYEAWNH